MEKNGNKIIQSTVFVMFFKNAKNTYQSCRLHVKALKKPKKQEK